MLLITLSDASTFYLFVYKRIFIAVSLNCCFIYIAFMFTFIDDYADDSNLECFDILTVFMMSVEVLESRRSLISLNFR